MMQYAQIKKYFSTTPYWQTQLFAFISMLVAIALVPIFIEPSTRLFILHYTIPFGVDLVGPWYSLYILPGIGAFLFIFNLAVSLFFFRRQKTLSVFFSITSFVTELILLSALYLVIIQNVS